ncbi:hypothetical protein LTR36_004560 [Oleoguttula mirabilis]|uniref:4'-phosphopantetheinyl transferase domain-containing protein n=1 Tax=Oleoguttula mirabilis TaxID=1507867 RepID=A0AAV9JG97_9PEZI|nr:hypothetical protein LTR36_004560 [Oleoguttula mirabilis]
MPPRPFPYPLSIGTDIAHTVRIQRIVAPVNANDAPTRLFRFMRQFLTYREQQEFWARFKGARTALGPQLPHVARYLAGRWAAKEAAIKAVHWRTLSALHVQILRRQPGSHGGGPLYAVILDKPAASRPSGKRAHPPVSAEPASMEPILDGFQDADQLEHGDATAQAPSGPGPSKPLDDEYTPAELQDDDIPGQIAQISISHDGEYATAVCLAAEEPSAGDVGGEAAARNF